MAFTKMTSYTIRVQIVEIHFLKMGASEKKIVIFREKHNYPYLRAIKRIVESFQRSGPVAAQKSEKYYRSQESIDWRRVSVVEEPKIPICSQVELS